MLLASVLGAMVVALDGTVLLIAQPVLGRELHTSVAQVQWTSTAYLVMVASLLVLAGRLGDRFGHSRLLWIGALGFGVASAGILFAPTIGWVIGLRALQGIFAALLQPATLALLRTAYPAERLQRAIGLRTSAIGIASATGPILGGVLVAQFGWRAVFAINVPIAALIVVLAARLPSTTTRPQRLNPLGAILLACPLAALVYTLSGHETLMGLTIFVIGTVAFAVHERRTDQTFIPAPVARSRPVMASMTLLLIVTCGMFGTLFAATFRLQNTLTPLEAGLQVLPLTVLMVLSAPLAALSVRRFGARRTAVTGTLLVAVGIIAAPLNSLIFAVLGAGFAAVMVTATGTVVGDAPAGYAGAIGGIKQTAMNLGPTLGIALATKASPALIGITLLALIPAALLPTGGSR